MDDTQAIAQFVLSTHRHCNHHKSQCGGFLLDDNNLIVSYKVNARSTTILPLYYSTMPATYSLLPVQWRVHLGPIMNSLHLHHHLMSHSELRFQHWVNLKLPIKRWAFMIIASFVHIA